MEVHPVDRLIELDLRPVLSHVVDPAGIRPRLDIDLVVTVVGSGPAFSYELRELFDQFWSRTVNDTVIVEACQPTSLKDRKHLNTLSVSLETVSENPSVEEVGEMTEVLDRFVSVDPMVKHLVFPERSETLLHSQG